MWKNKLNKYYENFETKLYSINSIHNFELDGGKIERQIVDNSSKDVSQDQPSYPPLS